MIRVQPLPTETLTSQSKMELDASFLTVVEDFLDTCDLATLSSANDGNTSNESPLSPADSIPDKPITLRHKVYRKRRRAEREQLELEIEKLKMKLAKEPRRLLSMSGWRMVAMCKLEVRLVSEQRQRQLRSAVSAQAALIQAYQGLVHGKLANGNTLEIGNSNSNHYHRDKLRLESFDIEFYRTSARTFNAIYAQTDEVFDSCGLDPTDEHYGAYTRELKDENDRSYFQFTDKRKILSSFEHTCNTLKRTLSLHQKQDQRLYEGMEDAGNTVAFKFRVITRLKTGVVASSLMRVINRWYQEENRMVVVWRALAEGEGAFSEMHADEIGWEIISPTPGAPGNTLLRLCAHCVPMNFRNMVTREQEQAAEKFSGMVVGTSTSNADEIACTLEKLVLKDAEE